jgi:hypothetical protein
MVRYPHLPTPPVPSDPERLGVPWTHAQFKKQAKIMMATTLSDVTDLTIHLFPPANFTQKLRDAIDQVAVHHVVSIGKEVLNRVMELKAQSAGNVPYPLGIEVKLSAIGRDIDGNEMEETTFISAEITKCLGLALISFGMPELDEILENGTMRAMDLEVE